MGHDLEVPGAHGIPDWDSLYRARGDEVVGHRPVFTGDVFHKVRVQSLDGAKTKSVIILQHPCALRIDGITLEPRLRVAEVRSHKVIPLEDWTGHVAKMPLPELMPRSTSAQRHQAAFFNAPYLVGPDALDAEKRIAVLSQTGVNLLLQRWVHHNSRATIPTATYQEVSSPAYEEADLIEEWCEDRLDAGIDLRQATTEAVTWLRGHTDGVMRQRRLENPSTAARSDARCVRRGGRWGSGIAPPGNGPDRMDRAVRTVCGSGSRPGRR